MRTAVITGVSSGIGKSTTERLLSMDWKVYGLSRRKPDIALKNFVWLECDLSKSVTIQKALRVIDEETVDLLVSNAGVAFEEPASKATQKSYEKMFSVNVLAPMIIVNALREKINEGTIITISSVSDRLVEKDFALYCSSKAANTRYFESLADEMKNAKVYSLLPDYVDTPMLRKLQEGRNFEWNGTIKVSDLASLVVEFSEGKYGLESGSNVIVVTNMLIEDLENRERLYGFNTDTNQMMRI